MADEEAGSTLATVQRCPLFVGIGNIRSVHIGRVAEGLRLLEAFVSDLSGSLCWHLHGVLARVNCNETDRAKDISHRWFVVVVCPHAHGSATVGEGKDGRESLDRERYGKGATILGRVSATA